MSNPRRACKFLTPFLEPSGERYKLNLQFPLVSKESEDIEHQPLKKPRVSEVGSDSMMIPERRNKWLHYKTQLCQKFKRGCCHYGEACLFAHGINDMRNTVPNSENEKGLLGRTKDAHNRICDELQLCRWFVNGGQCTYGDKCRFRHVIPKSFRDESVITISTSGSKGSLISGSGQFGCKRSMDFDTNGENGGRRFRKQRSVAAGRGLLNNGCTARGHFAHGHAAPRELRGYNSVDSRTVQTKHSKTCTSSKRHEQGMNYNFKYWNELEKMSHIYADWIEEIPPVHSKVECGSSVRMRHG